MLCCVFAGAQHALHGAAGEGHLFAGRQWGKRGFLSIVLQHCSWACKVPCGTGTLARQQRPGIASSGLTSGLAGTSDSLSDRVKKLLSHFLCNHDTSPKCRSFWTCCGNTRWAVCWCAGPMWVVGAAPWPCPGAPFKLHEKLRLAGRQAGRHAGRRLEGAQVGRGTGR